jgi:hypothetical protein
MADADELTRAYLRHLDARAVAWIVDGSQRRGLRYNSPATTDVVPLFLDGAEYARHLRAAERVVRAVDAAVARLAADARARRACLVPERFDPLIALDEWPTRPVFPARPDAFVDDEGRLRVLEINTLPPGDFAGPLGQLAEVFLTAPPFAAPALRTAPLRYDATLPRVLATLASLRPGSAPLRLGVVGEREGYWVMASATEALTRLGIEIVWALANELTVERGRVICGGVAVDQLLLGHPIKLGEDFRDHPLVVAALAGARLPLLRGLRSSLLLGRKSTLALLTSDDFCAQLPGELARAVRAHVPWTRVVRDGRTSDEAGRPIELLEHVRLGREQLVLKPTSRQAGDGVVRGWTVTPPEWEAALATALATPHVVQARVEPRTRLTAIARDGELTVEERAWDLNPYVWSGPEAQGVFVRSAPPGALTNLAAGAGLVPCLCVG